MVINYLRVYYLCYISKRYKHWQMESHYHICVARKISSVFLPSKVIAVFANGIIDIWIMDMHRA